jgi:hypothetical protein
MKPGNEFPIGLAPDPSVTPFLLPHVTHLSRVVLSLTKEVPP